MDTEEGKSSITVDYIEWPKERHIKENGTEIKDVKNQDPLIDIFWDKVCWREDGQTFHNKETLLDYFLWICKEIIWLILIPFSAIYAFLTTPWFRKKV